MKQQGAAADIRIDNDDIGGVVASANGAEAGAWVIAETTDLPTKFAKIVVTDDRGRYVLPDLPGANYNIWVRGYGLVDSPRVRAVPGTILNLKAVIAPNAAAAAEYYPALTGIPCSRFRTRASSLSARRRARASGWPASRLSAACHVIRWATGRRARFRRSWGSSKTLWRRGSGASFPDTTVHNPMFDEAGRVWLTARIRPPANAAFCKKGSDHPSARLFPLERAGRHAAMYDPKTKNFTLIDTCFSTHHLVFADDAANTLWFSGGGAASGVLGWLNTKRFLETGDEATSQGWTAFILDTNGNGRRDEYVEPDQPIDPTKDKRITAGYYGVGVSPVDGSIWGSVLGFPGAVIRVTPGENPPATTLTEIFETPWNDPTATGNGYGPRGMDIDRNGVVWVPLASGHLASFDRRRCKVLNGPTATGEHCPQGWSLYPFPGPQFQGVTDPGSAQASYYTWVDQHNTFGLGRNVPFATGNLADSLEALVEGTFVTLRIPYPMGFHAKGMDGRIDDPQAGWKGRGLWSAYAGRATHHIEGGKGTKPKVVKFQLRPDPLAK